MLVHSVIYRSDPSSWCFATLLLLRQPSDLHLFIFLSSSCQHASLALTDNLRPSRETFPALTGGKETVGMCTWLFCMFELVHEYDGLFFVYILSMNVCVYG